MRKQYVVPGMTPFSTTSNKRQAERDARRAQKFGLDGRIAVYDAKTGAEIPRREDQYPDGRPTERPATELPLRKFAFYIGNPIVKATTYEAVTEQGAWEQAQDDYSDHFAWESSQMREVIEA